MSDIRRRGLLLAFLALLSACERIPQDPEGTLDRIRDKQAIRVGIVSSGEKDASVQRALIARLQQATRANAVVERGATEPLLVKLQDGALDVVIGEFDTATPWNTHVTFVPETKTLADRGLKVASFAVARNGENEWITLLHREARSLEKQQ